MPARPAFSIGRATLKVTASVAIVAIGLLIAALPNAHAKERPTIDVYLIGGQSNAVGAASESHFVDAGSEILRTLESDDRVIFAYQNSRRLAQQPDSQSTWGPLTTQANGSGALKFGAEYGLAEQVLDNLDNRVDKVAILKAATGGSNLTYWDPNTRGSHFDRHTDFWIEQLAALAQDYPNHLIRVRALMWVQGESDALSASLTSSYGENLSTILAGFQATLDMEFPLVYSALAGGGNQAAINEQVAAISADRDDWTITPDTKHLAMYDGLHYNGYGALGLGRLLGAAVDNVVVPNEPGDADCSHGIDLRDAQIAAAIVGGARVATPGCSPDFDLDDEIAEADIMAILRCALLDDCSEFG